MKLFKIEAIVDNSFLKNTQETVYEKDVWKLSEVGIKPPPYIRATSLSFKKINPEWLRSLAKKFIRFQAATKAFYTLEAVITALDKG